MQSPVSKRLVFYLRQTRPHRLLIRQNHSQSNPSSFSSVNSPRTTSFGFKTIPEDAKESLVKNVFDSVASSYDLMNDATSLGVHRLWKDTFVSSLRPGKKGAMRCIDVAGGTGDIALRILDHARETYADRETCVEVVDINGQMLKEGFRRFKKTMYHNSESSPAVHGLLHTHYPQRLKYRFTKLMHKHCQRGSSRLTPMTYTLSPLVFATALRSRPS